MFYLIGMGLGGWKGISLKGWMACQNSKNVYIERYTHFMDDKDLEKIEESIGEKIIELSRSELENDFENIIAVPAKTKDIVLLVGGDPLTATTHFEFIKTCIEKKVKYKVMHSSSILSSVSETGLFIYKYGKTCSIPFFEKNYHPSSFFDIIEQNQSIGAHTLVLLDIQKEKNNYMSIKQGLKTLLEISSHRDGFLNENTMVVAVSSLGREKQRIKYASIKELIGENIDLKPNCIIIPGKLNSVEKEYLSIYS